MKTIWKTTVQIDDSATVQLPHGARALSCREAEGFSAIDIWWLVDTENAKVDTPVTIAGTGHPLDGRTTEMRFIGTTAHQWLRFHVFAP